MNIRKQLGRTVSQLSILFVILLFSVSMVNGFSLFGDKMTQVDAQGAVKVSATLITEKDMNDKTSFQLYLDTHSVDLSQYNIEKITALQFDDGQLITDGIWDFSGAGHHFRGMLTFAHPIPPDTKIVRLFIRDIDGVKERVFEWPLS